MVHAVIMGFFLFFIFSFILPFYSFRRLNIKERHELVLLYRRGVRLFVTQRAGCYFRAVWRWGRRGGEEEMVVKVVAAAMATEMAGAVAVAAAVTVAVAVVAERSLEWPWWQGRHDEPRHVMPVESARSYMSLRFFSVWLHLLKVEARCVPCRPSRPYFYFTSFVFKCLWKYGVYVTIFPLSFSLCLKCI